MSDYGKKEQTYGSGKNIWVDVPKVYPVGGRITNAGDFADDGVIPAGSMCQLDTVNGTIKIIKASDISSATEGVEGVAEVDLLVITAGATAAGDVTVTLNGVPATITVAANDTAAEVAAKIAAVTFAGWTADAGGNVVVFTANAVGEKAAPAFDGGTTGVTGGFTVAIKGVAPVEPTTDDDIAKINGLLYNDVLVDADAINAASTGTVVYEGMVFEDMLAEPIPAAVKAILPQITYFKHA